MLTLTSQEKKNTVWKVNILTDINISAVRPSRGQSFRPLHDLSHWRHISFSFSQRKSNKMLPDVSMGFSLCLRVNLKSPSDELKFLLLSWILSLLLKVCVTRSIQLIFFTRLIKYEITKSLLASNGHTSNVVNKSSLWTAASKSNICVAFKLHFHLSLRESKLPNVNKSSSWLRQW